MTGQLEEVVLVELLEHRALDLGEVVGDQQRQESLRTKNKK